MTKEEMEDLVKLVNQFGDSCRIGQINLGNGVYVENVYTTGSPGHSETDSSQCHAENGSYDTIVDCDLQPNEATQSASSGGSFPESELDTTLFDSALKMDEVKRMLAKLVLPKRENRTLKIVHWFIVWKVFRHYRLIPEEKTQAKFIRWVKEVFGWEWNSSDFKGSNVPDAVRTTPLNKWTVEGLSAQRPQAEEYIRWRGLLISSFMEKSPKGRVDCKESFCIRWFDTGVGED